MLSGLRGTGCGLLVLLCATVGNVMGLGDEVGSDPRSTASAVTASSNDPAGNLPPLILSAKSGPWSAPEAWETGKVPPTGSRVQVRPGHTIVYDLNSDQPIRSIHVAGRLRFATDRDTRLDVGLIKIQAGLDPCETGFECDAHRPAVDPNLPKPALEVGTPNKPIESGHTALIRLVHFKGLDAQSCPAIVCCGGRMDFHGAAMSRTWLKLGATIKQGETKVKLTEPVTGWRVGDRIILTATRRLPGSMGRVSRSGIGNASEKIIATIDGDQITLKEPIEEDRLVQDEFQPEVANLSRNVIVESADPDRARGHTMYHRDSAGSISYAEFRHLGKEGVLGRYSLHFHLVGDTMRGSYVIGASIWDSGNRWLTIHGTNYLVIRDCVGYLSKGHGYFLEDGTEVYNVLDRNLAVQAYTGKPLPNQVLPFDRNEGAGFWWANCLNTFTRNVGSSNDRYAFRFEMRKTKTFDPTLPIQQPDGSVRSLDVRTLPFVRFNDNESHHGRFSGVSIGEGGDRVGPDHQHPLVIRNLKIWAEHYSFRPQSPAMILDNLRMAHSTYGFYYPNYDHHVYRNVHVSNLGGFVFKRSNDAQGTPFSKSDYDFSTQYGPLTVDGLTLDNCGPYRDDRNVRSMIGISDYNPTGTAVSHFRNVKVINYGPKHRIMVDRGPWPEPPLRKPDLAVPVYVHDYFGPNRHAKIVSTAAEDFGTDGLTYREETPLTGYQSRVAEVNNVAFPQVLDPVDDLPPTTVITHILPQQDGQLLVRGDTADNGDVTKVVVNGREAKAMAPNFSQWEILLPENKEPQQKLQAYAEDAAGNIEPRRHVVAVNGQP